MPQPVAHPFTRMGVAENLAGLQAVTFDPRSGIQGNAALTAGQIVLFEIFAAESFLCSSIWAAVAGTAGVTLTNCFAGLYDDTGTLIGVTADQSSQWTSTGVKQMSLVTPVMLQNGRRYYVALLVGSAATLPNFSRGATVPALNAGSAAPFRSSTFGSGLTALPATIAFGSAAANSTAWWGALS